jgi:hypothetical protein
MKDRTHRSVFASTLRLVWAALLLISGLFLGAGPTLAQTPDTAAGAGPAAPAANYELRAWTVDGGGAGYVAGSGYTLGGTAGQPDADLLSGGGGGYVLRGGFWRPSCIAAVVPVTISRSGDDVVLAWTHDSANQAYYVHRSTTPYFTPSLATRQGSVTEAPWEFRDVGVLEDVNVNYAYLVRPACGAAYVDTGRRGEFEFRLVSGLP